jgi:SAM-dependent methyltransferase
VNEPPEVLEPLRGLGAALVKVPPDARDAFVDRALGLGPLPDDDPSLPRGCVPYLPCPVDTLLRVVEQASVRPSDVFVDVGSGVGRPAALVHLLTGARAVGVEIQPALVSAARELATRLRLSGLSFFEGDAVELVPAIEEGTVFFLYCPFSGSRLARLLARLEPLARKRTIRVCCVDVPLPACDWLTPVHESGPDLTIYRSTPVERYPAGPPTATD